MQRWSLSRGMGSALVGLLAVGVAGSAGAATLAFTGTLRIHIGAFQDLSGNPAYLTVPGTGAAQVTDDGAFHLLSFTLPGGTFGPSTVTFPGSSLTNVTGISSLRLTLSKNTRGSFSGISGGPPGGGPMGLSGIAKICLIFAPGCVSFVPLPLTPTAFGGAGFGIGFTQTTTGPVNVTLQNAPWTMATTPVMTIHTGASSTTTPALPGGFAYGPAGGTSSTAQPSGVVQLVTVSKVYTSLGGEFPVTGILTLRFVPEPGTLLLLGLGVVGLAILGRKKKE